MQGLFEDYVKCACCGRYLPRGANEGDICGVCQEVELFAKVKDYVRNNRVNEYQLAMHFEIPLKLVKKWLNEGRIEYYIDENADNKYLVFCLDCGIPLSKDNKGLLCPRCELKRKNIKVYSNQIIDEGRIRFDINK